jgi:hypothetical protein
LEKFGQIRERVHHGHQEFAKQVLERQNVGSVALGPWRFGSSPPRGEATLFPLKRISPSWPLTMTKLQFLGVSYDSSRREQPTATPVEHTYRGQQFEAPLRHEESPKSEVKTLYYRGRAYQRRVAEAAAQVQAD